MKVSLFAFLAVVATAATIGLTFLAIIIHPPPFQEVTATYHSHNAADNTKDDDHQEERIIAHKRDLREHETNMMFFPGAPAATLNDRMYTMNRQLDSYSCEDSPLKVLTKKGMNSAKTCAFLGKKPTRRCKGRVIKSHCPNACRSCESFGTSDSEATFIFEGDKTTCTWLHDLVTRSTLTEVSSWCQLDSLRATCRETCSFFCSDGPEQSSAPSLSPSTLLPSSSPTTCSDKITYVINEHFGDVVKGPPQEQALAWLVKDITNSECDNEAMMMQRYVLAVFYFSTGGVNWKYSGGWLESGTECDWYEVICNYKQQVKELLFYTAQ